MSALKHNLHRVNNAVQTACCAAFLSESHDAERLLLAMLNHRHNLCSKFNLLQVQVYCFSLASALDLRLLVAELHIQFLAPSLPKTMLRCLST